MKLKNLITNEKGFKCNYYKCAIKRSSNRSISNDVAGRVDSSVDSYILNQINTSFVVMNMIL